MNRQQELQAHPLVDQEWEQVLRLIPVDLALMAKENKALVRRREVKSAADLLRLVLAYSLCDWSLRLVGAWATLIGLGHLSDVAVMKRLQGCQRWLGKLIVAWLLKRRVILHQQNIRLRIVDATAVSHPGSQGTDWRVHLSFDLGQMCLDGIEVTDASGGETLTRCLAKPGDILVADRGYAHPPGLGAMLLAQASVVVRISWRTLPLQQSPGQPLDLIAWLRQVPQTDPAERDVWLDTPHGTFRLRLVACRLSDAAAERARQRCRRIASKKGKTLDQRTLFAASFVMVVTNLSTERWTAQQILDLYRVRWQIELACKRLKSVLHLDHLRAQDPALAQVYLFGKLLATLITDVLTGQAIAQQPTWFESVDRPVSAWRWLMLVSDSLRDAVRGMISLSRILDALPNLKRYLRDAPRKRRQQLAGARAILSALAGA